MPHEMSKNRSPSEHVRGTGHDPASASRPSCSAPNPGRVHPARCVTLGRCHPSLMAPQPRQSTLLCRTPAGWRCYALRTVNPEGKARTATDVIVRSGTHSAVV